MKVLVLGGNGMLGHKLVEVLGDRFDVFASVRSENSALSETGIIGSENIYTGVDCLNFETVDQVISEAEPEVILNAIGLTKQKPTARDPILNIEINSLLPHKVARIASRFNARTITFSTDCVFLGSQGGYTEDDPTDAEDLYGMSKSLGELKGPNCLTLRSSIIGRELGESHGLVEWLISKQGKAVKGFANAVFSGLTTLEMAKLVGDLISNRPGLSGVYHISSAPINKYELLLLIEKYFELGVSIEKDEAFVIDRSLDSSRFRNESGYEPESWEKMIQDMAKDATKYPEWRKLKY